MLAPLRWLARNFGALLLAFVLAVSVWVSAVISSDPNEERPLARQVPIEVVGQDASLYLMGELEQAVNLTLKAPASVWGLLDSDPQAVRAMIDLSSYGPGNHSVPVLVQIEPHLVRLVSQDPLEVQISLELVETRSFPLTVVMRGSPPTGYQTQPATIDPSQVSVTGPQSLVSRVNEVRVTLDVTGATETISRQMTPIAIDADGRVVTGLVIIPDTVSVSQPVSLLGGFRYVIVRAVSTGQVASGYRLTNIFVSPVGVVVFSADPDLVNNLPGYVETMPLDLIGADNDFEMLVDLNLPDGISVVGDPKVLVQVSIATIESSLAISLPVDVIGLTPGLQASLSPATVNLIVSGPVPILNNLQPSDIRIVVNLTDYTVGTYQVIPMVDFLPENVQRVSILPATIEVAISVAPTPTPSGRPTPTPTPTRSP